ncbi:diguanylate cyclase [Caballeronia sp. AZ1_KS37]
MRDLGRMAEPEMAALQLVDELTLLSNRRFTKKLSILIGLHI